MMTTPRRNLGLVAAASMALVLGGTAAVVAQTPGGNVSPDVGTAPSIDVGTTDEQLQRPGNRRGQSFRGRGGQRGQRGFAPRRGMSRLGLDQRVVRSETIFDAGDDGFVTQRVENGTVAAAGADSLTIDLANGESSEIAITDDTTVLTIDVTTDDDGSRGRRGRRAQIMEGSIDDVATGDSVNVASRSTDGGPFEASRVVVRADAAADAADDAAATDATDAGATDEATTLEIPADVGVPATA